MNFDAIVIGAGALGSAVAYLSTSSQKTLLAEETLYIKMGGLDFAKADNVHFLATRQAMADSGVIFEELSPQEVASRFPLFCLDEDMWAIYQADVGQPSLKMPQSQHYSVCQRYNG